MVGHPAQGPSKLLDQRAEERIERRVDTEAANVDIEDYH